MTKSELKSILVKALHQLDDNNIPEEFVLYSNIDRGRVKYKNNKVWDLDLYLEYHEGENIVFFNYDGDEEPGFDPKMFQL